MSDTIPEYLQPGRSYPVFLTFRNTGLVDWESSIHRIGLLYEGDLTKIVAMPVFVDLPHGANVSPGREVTFATTILPVGIPGTYPVSFSVVMRSAQGDQKITEVKSYSLTIVPTDGISSPLNGSILIEGHSPDLVFSVDGIPYGHLPGILPDLTPGVYSIRVTGTDYDAIEEVMVEKGSISRLYFEAGNTVPSITTRKSGALSDGTMIGYIEANIPLLLIFSFFILGCVLFIVHGLRKRKQDEEKAKDNDESSESEDIEKNHAELEKKLLDQIHNKPPLFEAMAPSSAGRSAGGIVGSSFFASALKVNVNSRAKGPIEPLNPLSGISSLFSKMLCLSGVQDSDQVRLNLTDFDIRPGGATAFVGLFNGTKEEISSGGFFIGSGEEKLISYDLDEPDHDEYLTSLPVKIILSKERELEKTLFLPYNRGIALLARGILEKAYEFFGQAFKDETAELDALFRRALILAGWNLEDEALSLLEEVLKRDPDHEGALSAIEEIVKKQKNRREKKEKEEKRIAEFPNELDVKYTPIRRLGSDPFAHIILVKRNDTGDLRVLKIQKTGQLHGQTLYTEISVLYQLRHPYVLRMYRAEFEPVMFLEQEYVTGVEYMGVMCKTLFDLPVPVPPSVWIDLVRNLAQGIGYLHQKGVRHYHLSPRHILLDDGMIPKISGLIRESLRGAGSPSGEEFFVHAPEQINSSRYGKPGRKTDLYQLGAIWYWLMTGEIPEGLKEEFEPCYSGPIPKSYVMWEDALCHLLSPDKKYRFRSAEEFLEIFDQICTKYESRNNWIVIE